MKRNLFALCLAVTLLLAGAVQAQSDRKGTAGAQYLLVPMTASTATLGAAYTAGGTGVSALESLLSNPAGLATNTGTGVIFSRTSYAADIGINYFGVAQSFGNNSLALTLSSWDFGDIPLQTEISPEIDPDRTWNAGTVVLGLTYGRQFTDRISAGVTAKALSEQIDDINSNGVAFDIGMAYTVGETGLRFGVSLQNFGPSMNYGGNGLVRFTRLSNQQQNATPNAVALEGADYELPSQLNFGATFTRDLGASASLTALTNFRSNSFSQDQYSGGLELGLADILYVRGGAQLQQDMDESFYEGYNFGAGLNLDVSGTALRVDYGYSTVDFFENIQMITASVTL
jgi:hypothetical protein